MAEEIANTNSNRSALYPVLCYLGILWLIPYFAVKGEERDEYFLKHLKQGFGVLLIEVFYYIWQAIGLPFGVVISIISLVLLIIGILNAVKGVAKDLPLIGGLFDSIPLK